MEYINNNQIQLPLIGLGTFSMHGEQLFNIISNAIQLGYSLFDTAVKYANEEDLGAVLKDTNNVLLQSKVHDIQLLGNLKYLRLNKKSVKKSYSLTTSRLGFAPDIYFLHSTFKGYEHSFEKLVSLRKKNIIKIIGICNISLDELKKLVKDTGLKPDIIQVEIHPYYNNRKILDYCKEQNIIVEARSPLAHGDVLHEWQSNTILQKIAFQHSKSVPQVILRWITQQNIIAITRTIDYNHLKDNINIFDFKLTEQNINDINSLNKDLSFGFISSKQNKVQFI